MKLTDACAIVLIAVLGLGSSTVAAQERPTPGTDTTADPLRRLELRLDELERENKAIRAENTRLLGQRNPGVVPTVAGTVLLTETPPPTPPFTAVGSPEPGSNATPLDGRSLLAKPATTSYTPGEGVTISMFNDTSKLTLGMSLSGLGIFSTQRPTSPGLPLFLFPGSPNGLSTNTFDLHARQSTIDARFTGPEFWGLTPGGEIVALFYNDNISTDNYGLLLYYAYGELKNDQMRFAAGLQRDIFNPVGPTILPVSYLYGSGNAGSYRGQIRFERFIRFSEQSQLTTQFALSEPISTFVRNSVTDPLVEDNGWPNVEGRLALGVGETREYMGGRKQRPVEFGASGLIGQIRITRPGLGGSEELDVEALEHGVWGLGCDLHWAITDRLGMKGELFMGQALGEYNAGVLQNYNSDTFRSIRTQGGYGEIYYYLHPKFHVHIGYGIDNPHDRDLAGGQITSNQTVFNTFIWDVSKIFQIGFEVDYRKTNYTSPLQDSDGFLFMTQFLWRF